MRCVALALLATACGNPATSAPAVVVPSAPPADAADTSPETPTPIAEHTPGDRPRAGEAQTGPEVTVRGVREGLALHVEIVGQARERVAGSSFEQADSWGVQARSDGVELERLVNGSTEISRVESLREGRWDVTVSFDTTFAMPPASDTAELLVTPPGAEARRFAVAAH